MRPLCIIPAKSVSVRLPEKNIKPLCGKPMVAWTIEAALKSGIFDEVFVSTESEEISGMCQGYGATIPYIRPAELTGDTVTNVDVSLHLLDFLKEKEDQNYDAVVCLQPSSPLKTADSIKGAWDVFVQEERDFLVSVAPIDPHYFHWAVEKKEDGNWGMFFGDRFMTVRQDLPDVFRPDGAIKIARADSLRARRNFFGENLSTFPIPENQAIHVATQTDFLIAEAYMKERINND